MDKQILRASQNYVNLGRLYSVPPWQPWNAPGSSKSRGFSKPSRNSVNLGNFYAPRRLMLKRPSGWAYLEDGSVFVAPHGWTDHDVLEARLKIAAHFVQDPSPRLKAIRQADPLRQRFLFVSKDGKYPPKSNTAQLIARNVKDGVQPLVYDLPVENVVLELDETDTYPVSANIRDALPLKYEHRVLNHRALSTFRGTLVDGKLQPNVRLGNGLDLSIISNILSPEVRAIESLPDMKAKRRDLDEFAARPVARRSGKINVPTPRKHFPASSPGSPRGQDEDLRRREADVARREQDIRLTQTSTNATLRFPQGDQASPLAPGVSLSTVFKRKAAELAAKERELEQREELLRWKRKAWLLEQKLARIKGDFVKTDHPQSKRDEHDEPQISEESEAHAVSQEPAEADFHESPDDMVSSRPFDLDNPAPPRDLAKLRSRLELPTKRKLRSNRSSSSEWDAIEKSVLPKY